MSEVPPPTVPPPSGGSYTPPPPPPGGGYTPPPAGGAGGDRTLMLVLSYLGILSLIPLIMKKDDPEVQWHAKNGLVLMGAEIVLAIAVSIISYFLPAVVNCGLTIIWCVFWLAILAFHIWLIMQAINGKRFRIPVVTDMSEKF